MSYSDVKIKTNSKFLKIKAGSPQIIRLIDSTPFQIMKHNFQEKGKLPQTCLGNICPHCEAGNKPRQRFITNVYNHTEKEVNLFEYGSSIANELKKIAIGLQEEGKDIVDFDLKMQAEGEGLAKKYSVTARTTTLALPLEIKRIEIENEIPF